MAEARTTLSTGAAQPLLVRAFAGACVLAGKLKAAYLLTAFDALLRPGEIYLLQVQDITFYGDQAVITLRDTKTGKRRSSGEMVVVESGLAIHYLRLACQRRSPRSLLLRDGAPSFRLLFRNLVAHFGLEGLFAVYSLRRGGATYGFLLHGSMEKDPSCGECGQARLPHAYTYKIQYLP